MEIVAVIHEENGIYGISFPDLPGCISAGDSRNEMLANAHEALALHYEGMAEDGQLFPKLRTEAALRGDPEFRDDFADAAEVLLLPLPDPLPKPKRRAHAAE